MARLITKFKYLKPEDRKNIGGYEDTGGRAAVFSGSKRTAEPALPLTDRCTQRSEPISARVNFRQKHTSI